MSAQQLIRRGQAILTRHAPEILTGISVIGTIATAVLSAKATPKAMELIKDAAREKGEDLTKGEMVRAGWKAYLPAIGTGIATCSCMIGANRVGANRLAATAALLTMREGMIQEYEEHMVKKLGEPAVDEVRAAAFDDDVQRAFKASGGYIEPTHEGDWPCYDQYSGRLFYSNKDKIEKARAEINLRLNGEMYASLNEFYDELNLPEIIGGNVVGWTSDEPIEYFHYSSGTLPNGRPYLAFAFSNTPRPDFNRLY